MPAGRDGVLRKKAGPVGEIAFCLVSFIIPMIVFRIGATAMSTILVTPINRAGSDAGFRAEWNSTASFGNTIGQAIDGLEHADDLMQGLTIIVLKPFEDDEFFTDDQKNRLTKLMQESQAARDHGIELPTELRMELEQLVREETSASGKRAEKILNRIRS